MEISKADWKLFREKIGTWQEKYMERLNEEYVELLTSNKPASVKFWDLDKRIKLDKRRPGVQLELRKSDVPLDIVALIRDGAITMADLDGFSEDLRDTVAHFVENY